MKNQSVKEMVVERELLLRDIAELEPYNIEFERDENGTGRRYFEVQRDIEVKRRRRYELGIQIKRAQSDAG